MAPKAKPRVTAKNIQGLKYFKQLQPLLARLHDIGTDSDRAGNRRLFFDDYAALILLFFFNPALGSLRALQQASCLDKVQKKLGCRRTSLGSLSAAARDFDAEPLRSSRFSRRSRGLRRGRDFERDMVFVLGLWGQPDRQIVTNYRRDCNNHLRDSLARTSSQPALPPQSRGKVKAARPPKCREGNSPRCSTNRIG